MKQINIVNAYTEMESLANNKYLTDEDQWNLYQLRKILKPHYEFQTERLNNLRDKYSKYADEQGTISGEPFEKYVAELNALNNMEKEIDFEKPSIANKGINFKTMEILEDFIDFYKE